VAQPASKTLYMGPTNSDPEIQPAPVGGTWYPAKPTSTAGPNYVVLHFHGGAYVIGNGRTADAGFAAKTLIKNTEATHVFAPQYRLSSNPGCRFPSQLIDALTSYAYLVNEENIAPQKIIISGDSAGANLALSLVRYLTEFGTTIGLAGPACAWLWSPWVNPVASLTTDGFNSSPHLGTDYINGMFGQWGAKTIQPSPQTGLTLSSGYISFKDNAFATETPIYISAGECEVLYHDCVDLYEQMRAVKGNKVELQIEECSPHDTILVGQKIGFEKEAHQAAKRAGNYLKTLTAS